jgi:hypothetical protein
LADLLRCGRAKSAWNWWAFEGFTEVDCCLETDHLLLFIEDKGNEPVSSPTEWNPYRNQLFRNLEVARDQASGKAFAALLIAERGSLTVTAEAVEQGFPHLGAEERRQLMQYYLGCVLWKDVCAAVGIDYATLPNTVTDAVKQPTPAPVCRGSLTREPG